jgi:hypothetical protein|tara:strand:- start:4258 stop:5094 length:837 start_codon:yes stop_codon:yes gene_type:complete
MKGLQKHNQQLTKQSKSIGLIKSDFSDNKIKIYEAYRGLKKIRDFTSNDELKPLIDLIGKWRYYIGIKEELSQEELFVNLNFIRENFNELNLVDIKQAIDLSIKGDLEVEAEHYQNFTPLYISKILNAYKVYRGKVIYAIRDKVSKIENQPKEPTLNEKVEITKTSLESMFSNREDKRFYDYGGVTYDFIKRNSLLVFSKSLVEEAMEYGKKESVKEIRKSTYADVIQSSNKNYNNAKEKKDSVIRNSARNYVVQKWLNSFSEESFNKFLLTIDHNMI